MQISETTVLSEIIDLQRQLSWPALNYKIITLTHANQRTQLSSPWGNLFNWWGLGRKYGSVMDELTSMMLIDVRMDGKAELLLIRRLVVCLGVTLINAQGLLLTICSEITPRRAQRAIWSVGNRIQVSCLQAKHHFCCPVSPATFKDCY